MTPRLPKRLRAALEARGEILEALSVTSHPDHAPFLRGAQYVELPPGVERREVKEGADSDWLNHSQTVQRILPGSDHTFDASELTTSLGLSSGATVWLATRPHRPEGGWTPLGRLRLALSEAAQRNGDLVLGDAPLFLWVT